MATVIIGPDQKQAVLDHLKTANLDSIREVLGWEKGNVDDLSLDQFESLAQLVLDTKDKTEKEELTLRQWAQSKTLQEKLKNSKASNDSPLGKFIEKIVPKEAPSSSSELQSNIKALDGAGPASAFDEFFMAKAAPLTSPTITSTASASNTSSSSITASSANVNPTASPTTNVLAVYAYPADLTAAQLAGSLGVSLALIGSSSPTSDGVELAQGINEIGLFRTTNSLSLLNDRERVDKISKCFVDTTSARPEIIKNYFKTLTDPADQRRFADELQKNIESAASLVASKSVIPALLLEAPINSLTPATVPMVDTSVALDSSSASQTAQLQNFAIALEHGKQQTLSNGPPYRPSISVPPNTVAKTSAQTPETFKEYCDALSNALGDGTPLEKDSKSFSIPSHNVEVEHLSDNSIQTTISTNDLEELKKIIPEVLEANKKAGITSLSPNGPTKNVKYIVEEMLKRDLTPTFDDATKKDLLKRGLNVDEYVEQVKSTISADNANKTTFKAQGPS